MINGTSIKANGLGYFVIPCILSLASKLEVGVENSLVNVGVWQRSNEAMYKTAKGRDW